MRFPEAGADPGGDPAWSQTTIVRTRDAHRARSVAMCGRPNGCPQEPRHARCLHRLQVSNVRRKDAGLSGYRRFTGHRHQEVHHAPPPI